MSVLNGSTVLRLSRVVFRDQDESSLIYLPSQDQLFLVPRIGEQILRRCDGTRTVNQIKSEFCKEAETSQLANEKFDLFLAGMVERGVLSVRDPDDHDEIESMSTDILN